MVWVNSENVTHLPSPFGGMKARDRQRRRRLFSFDFYMETKNVCIALDTHKVSRIGTDRPQESGLRNQGWARP